MSCVKKLIVCGAKLLFFIAVLFCFTSAIPTAYADTDGSELKITDQPDQLILALGLDWAGTQFELSLDTGIFPVPVTVNENGILTMDLGGSKTYTLTLLEQEVAGTATPEPSETPPGSEGMDTVPDPEPGPESDAEADGIPAMHLVLFLGGLAAGIGVLVFMYLRKKRRDQEYDDYEYEDDE